MRQIIVKNNIEYYRKIKSPSAFTTANEVHSASERNEGQSVNAFIVAASK